MRKYLLLLIGFSFIISCDKDDTTDSIPEDKFLELVYDNSYLYPEGFYHGSNLIGNVYYENTVSIKPTNERAHIWIELNTNDMEQAKTWSDLSNEYSSVERELVDKKETEKYFEFVRVNVQNHNDTLLSRVHRSDYFTSLHDKFTDIETVGIYNGELSIDEVKEMIEYLWDCRTIGLYDKVVESIISESENKFEYYIQSLYVVYGDFGIKDMIYVYDNHFQLDKSNRILTVNRELIKEMEGKQN